MPVRLHMTREMDVAVRVEIGLLRLAVVVGNFSSLAHRSERSSHQAIENGWDIQSETLGR